MFKIAVLVCKCLSGTGYLSDLYIPVASASGRQHLGSASTDLYYKFSEPEPWSHWQSFAVAGPSC